MRHGEPLPRPNKHHPVKYYCSKCGHGHAPLYRECDGLRDGWVQVPQGATCESSVQSATSPVHDPVNHPPHYKAGGIECIDAIEAALTPEEFRGYCKGNALKYVWRERHKGGAESLAKAQWYLKRLEGAK